MLVLAKGQRNLLRVPGGVGDGGGGCRGVGNAVGADVDAGVEVGACCGVPVGDGATDEVCPSADPGEFTTVGVGSKAMFDCA